MGRFVAISVVVLGVLGTFVTVFTSQPYLTTILFRNFLFSDDSGVLLSSGRYLMSGYFLAAALLVVVAPFIGFLIGDARARPLSRATLGPSVQEKQMQAELQFLRSSIQDFTYKSDHCSTIQNVMHSQTELLEFIRASEDGNASVRRFYKIVCGSRPFNIWRITVDLDENATPFTYSSRLNLKSRIASQSHAGEVICIPIIINDRQLLVMVCFTKRVAPNEIVEFEIEYILDGYLRTYLSTGRDSIYYNIYNGRETETRFQLQIDAPEGFGFSDIRNSGGPLNSEFKSIQISNGRITLIFQAVTERKKFSYVNLLISRAAQG